MAQDRRGDALVYFCSAVGDLLGAVLYRALGLELADMNTVTELWQQSQNDAEGMRLGYTTQQHYFAALVAAAEQKKWEDQTAIDIHEAILDEREACAKVCEEVGVWPSLGPKHCAAAIRARGQA